MSSQAVPRPQPARVFLSYKRDIEPDASIAMALYEAIGGAHDVFIDRRSIKLAQDWAEQIDQALRTSDYLVVLLTEQSSQSENVKQEVSIALRSAAKRSDRKPIIVPVRLAFRDPLPYALGAALDRIQYALWEGPHDTDRIVSEVLSVIGGAAFRGDGTEPVVGAQPCGAGGMPQYAAPVAPGGTAALDDPFYVERPADSNALAAMNDQRGRTVLIKGPRQMGKSSLLNRMMARAMNTEPWL